MFAWLFHVINNTIIAFVLIILKAQGAMKKHIEHKVCLFFFALLSLLTSFAAIKF